MTKKRSTKRALLLSFLSLLMCVSMLIGSTYAWFTDSVTSANNVIKSGTLDIEMYWAEGADAVPTDDSGWTDASKGAIFNYNLWEPGYVQVRHIKIANEGSLALKYQLNIAANGEVSKLADVIDVYFADPAEQIGGRADLSNAKRIGTLTEVLAGMPANTSGELTAGDNATVTIALKMQETAGNEYQNLSIGSDFSVQLLATQLTYEEDSFDKDYDAGSTYEIPVKSAAELHSAIATIKDGAIITLEDNIVFDANAHSVVSGYKEGLYYEGDKSFTINLNGKTISNDSTVNDYLLLFRNDGEKANTITIKNGTIEATSTAFSAVCTSTFSKQQITVNLENVNVIGNNSNGAVLKPRGGAVLNVKNGTVVTGNDNYVCIEAVNATVNVYDGTEFYQNGKSSYVGNLIGVSFGGTANVYGGYGKSAQGALIVMSTGGTINVSGGEWIANTDGTASNDNKAVLNAQLDTNSPGAVDSAVINVTGGTFKGGYYCWSNVAGKADINISAGSFNSDPSAYAKGQVVNNGNGTWTVKPYEVNTAAALEAELAAGNPVTLTADVALTSKLTISKDAYIDGNGKTIKFTSGTSDRFIDVPKETNGANLTIKNAVIDIDGSYCQRGINYNTNGTLILDNVTLTGTTKAIYGINLPSGSANATVEMTNCDITALIALNVWGENVVVNVKDCNLSNFDNNATEGENYATVKLNNDGTNSAEGSVITITGGTITAKDETGADFVAVNNNTATGAIMISDTTVVNGITATNVAVVRYKDGNGNFYNEFYGSTTLQSAVTLAAQSTNSEVFLLTDITVDTLEVPAYVTVHKNGHNLTVGATTGSGTLNIVD